MHRLHLNIYICVYIYIYIYIQIRPCDGWWCIGDQVSITSVLQEFEVVSKDGDGMLIILIAAISYFWWVQWRITGTVMHNKSLKIWEYILEKGSMKVDLASCGEGWVAGSRKRWQEKERTCFGTILCQMGLYIFDPLAAPHVVQGGHRTTLTWQNN